MQFSRAIPKSDRKQVSASRNPRRMKWLRDIAQKMHDPFQCVRAGDEISGRSIASQLPDTGGRDTGA